VNGNGFPTWVKIVAQVGAPLALAGYLLMRFDGLVQAQVFTLKEHHALAVEQAAATQLAHADMLPYLRAICRHTAKTELERRDCD
jgi:hypothetical protein